MLKNPQMKWRYPSVTTHGRNNHAIRSQHFRYIRYSDGSEEFYDHRTDPNEWHNLAGKPEYDSIIAEHKQWLPKVNVQPSLDYYRGQVLLDPLTLEWKSKKDAAGDPRFLPTTRIKADCIKESRAIREPWMPHDYSPSNY
jgi:hypothetical protein